VAIKFVGEKELRDNPGAAAILRDEARHAGKLMGHPQIVGVLDLIEVDTDLHAGPAVVLEYIDGCHSGEWIEFHSKKLTDVTKMYTGLFIAMSIVEAVQAAHRLSILHRDVKPQNVLCSVDGRIKVADFGLSRVVEAITRTHTVWGRHTPLYSAPEQWKDEKPDEESDVYQVSATLYHLLAGQPVNQGASLIGLLRWHETGTPVSLKVHLPELDKEVADILDKGVSPKRGERPSLWQIYDALSGALLKNRLKLTVSAKDLSPEARQELAKFLDFNMEGLEEEKGYGTEFGNPLEAIQEAIGATLRGATAQISIVELS
jgi:serine/threonine protein kinase